MRYTNLFFYLLIISLISFTSCKEDEFSEEIQEIETVDPVVTSNNNLVAQMSSSPNNTDGLELGCFSVVYPFNLLVDGVTVEINSEDDFIAVIAEAEYLDFEYPLNIVTADGEAVSVTDSEQLGELFASCVPDTGWENEGFPAFLINDVNYCYNLSYPVSVTDVEGAVLTAENESAFVEILVEHPIVFFVFPLELVDDAGVVTTVNSEDELFSALWECDPGTNPTDTCFGGIGFIGCYEIQFPINILNETGDVISIADENELTNNLLNGNFVNFSYPINLIDEDGNVLEIVSEEALNEALENCTISIGFVDLFVLFSGATIIEGTCYELVYPITGFNDNSTLVLENDEQTMDYLSNPSEIYQIQFPVSITLLSTGETVEVVDQNQLLEILTACQ